MSEMNRERDLVLSPNEYAYVLDKTKGLISCVVGSYKMSLSNSDALVVFDENAMRFKEASFEEAIATFVSAPENWYIVLKNPVKVDNMQHPTCGTANTLPELQIGKKINIRGNTSFALYPGQMAKVVQGHSLHSNQYLLARVYDADVLNANIKTPEPTEENPNPVPEHEPYITGQILVIKGTEHPFYIPPTGIEVIPIGGSGNRYVRNAVTLEKLEYCILKNEKGVKKYIHGDAVVFPQPDEVFLVNPETSSDNENKYKFRAIELSPISGIYVKVISDYTEGEGENEVTHKVGEELFITGNEQMIYYPRPEHAIIDYEGRILHHAIEIPAGEGRYILDRMKGDVKLVKGPAMYLPDPRTEVVVQRKLSKKQCELWYPGNREALEFNIGIGDDSESRIAKVACNSMDYSIGHDAGFSRSNTFTKPRTITINNKYEGAVAINVWTGYAVNVVSKSGKRKVVKGPTTYLLEYDEVLESVTLSTGKPKTTDYPIETVYLRVDNNKVSDIINVQTKDFVDVSIKVSYCVDFLASHMDKWFNVENYVKYMCDRERSILKMEAKKYNIEEFYENTTSIVRKCLLNLNSKDEGKGRMFEENGMLIKDVEVLSISIEDDVEEIINDHQLSVVRKSLELANTDKEVEVEKKIAELNKERDRLAHEVEMYSIDLKSKVDMERAKKDRELEQFEDESKKAKKEAEVALQEALDIILDSQLARDKAQEDQKLAFRKANAKLDLDKLVSYSESVQKIFGAVTPDLISAMTSRANAELIQGVAESMSPYAIARGESIPETVNTLLRGTQLEDVLSTIFSAVRAKSLDAKD